MKILITGISGFIGRNTLRLLLKKKHEVTALVRPNTNKKRVAEFTDQINIEYIDLTEVEKLKNWLDKQSFEAIIHIGALRGGRKASKNLYYKANVDATQQLMIAAKNYDAKFIFCSSVGVFGAIPLELPANNSTTRQPDNYYHYTKIKAEELLQNYVLNGLNACVVRPSITYGAGDWGFPYTLCKLVKKRLMFLPDKPVFIHLGNVETVAQSFVKLLEYDYKPGACYNVADKKPVKLVDLVDFISKQIHNKEYPKSKTISYKKFAFFEKIAKKLKNELWAARFELISKSWYYDVNNTYHDLNLNSSKTIPEFKSVITWFLKK